MYTYPNPIRVPEYPAAEALVYGTREAFSDLYGTDGIHAVEYVVYGDSAEAASWMVDNDRDANRWSACDLTPADRDIIAAEWLACQERVGANPDITY